MKPLLKLFLPLGLVLLARAPGQAATVSGNLQSDSTWGPEHGPITVIGDLVIPEGRTLSLKPGAVIRVQPSAGGEESATGTENTDICVMGTLRALGLDGQRIVIESAAPYRWGALYFSVSSRKSALEFCNIRGGKVVANSASPTLVHCNILEGGGMEVANESFPTVRGCNIYYNTVGLRFWSAASGGVFRDNNIFQNGYGLYVDDILPARATVEDNNIMESKDYDLVYKGPQPFAMPRNYWGSVDADVLARRVFDGTDEKGRGVVEVFPILTAKNDATWALPVDPSLPPPAAVENLVYKAPMTKIRPPIGFFRAAHRRFGIELMPGLAIPSMTTGKFSYAADFHIGASLRLVYDESKLIGLECLYANFFNKNAAGVFPEESSQLTWLGLGLKGEFRPLDKKIFSPYGMVGGGIQRLSLRNVYFKDQKLGLNLTESRSSEWNMGLSMGLGLSAIFQKRIETQLGFRYHFVQRNASGDAGAPEAAKFAVIELNLMRYF